METTKTMIPMNLQLFAEPDAGQNATPQGNPQPQAAPVQVDYEKIQQMLNGTLAAKENTALKAYFKQQGLSQEEAEQAMASFKAEKAKNQPDVQAMQTQLTKVQQEAVRAKIENTAILIASSLGLDVKTIPYVMKMADLQAVMEDDGKVSEDKIKEAINKVLEDVPALKPNTAQSGFVQVGATGASQQPNNEDALKKAFGL